MRPTKLKKIFFFWFPAIFWMGLIFFLSSFHKLQVSTVGWQDFITRKLAHFTEYTILAILFFRGFKNTTSFSFTKAFFWSLVLTILYAVTDEYHQTFVSGRTGKPFDIGVDALGSAFGSFFALKITPLVPKRFRKILL